MNFSKTSCARMLILFAISVGLPILGEEPASSSIKIDNFSVTKNTTAGGDVDELITNNKLRAESGSKSKFSLATAFSYDGGSLEKPLEAQRPNIQGVAGTTDVADINGQINAKYNMTPRDSLLLGGGLRWISPLQGGKRPADYDGQLFDAFDPNLLYQRIYKFSGIQSYYQVGPTVYTRSDVVKKGFVANASISNVNAYEVGKTGLTLGLETQFQYGYFNPGVKPHQADYVMFLYPYLEFSFTDKVNFRTVSFLLEYEHSRGTPNSTWLKGKVLQSVGIGISVTRDIFLYPNVQFIPDDIRAGNTNVGLAANVNAF
jgi:hypothetical protein